MKALIVYESLHGTTEKCANILKDKLDCETSLLRLGKKEDIDLGTFDLIIIGGSIHMGIIHSRVKKFIQKNMQVLIDKPHGLYLCCMESGETAKTQFENAFPPELRKSSVAEGLFGGEFIFERMNLFQRMVTKKVAGINKSVSKINFDEIDRFVSRIRK